MKTIVKKISALAMALTLIGAGGAYTNSIAKETGKRFGIEADAAPWVIRDQYGRYWGLYGGGNYIYIDSKLLMKSNKGKIYVYKKNNCSYTSGIRIEAPELDYPIYVYNFSTLEIK